MARRPNILILGGTRLAREFADELANVLDASIVYSLAGITKTPKLPHSVSVRYGGFGGQDAFGDFLQKTRFDAVVDATHPFARQMSETAIEACKAVDCPYLSLVPQPWEPQPGDHWLKVATLEDAVTNLPSGSRVLLAIGRKQAEVFFVRNDCWFLVRSIEALEYGNPACNWHNLTDWPGQSTEDEIKLLQSHGINLIVSKNSGALVSYRKIEAAREIGIPVLMIERPQIPYPNQLFTVNDAITWSKDQVSF